MMTMIVAPPAITVMMARGEAIHATTAHVTAAPAIAGRGLVESGIVVIVMMGLAMWWTITVAMIYRRPRMIVIAGYVIATAISC